MVTVGLYDIDPASFRVLDPACFSVRATPKCIDDNY
jgi:hypothetical protein